MRYRKLTVLTVTALATVGVGAGQQVAATTPPAPAGATFGDMPSPCGPAGADGAATVADGQNGGATLRLGLASDRGYEARPQNVEMYDAAVAFAGWCNAQGGIRGLPIEIVDLDGKLFEVAPAMETACSSTFALVGGGWVFDDAMFPRFHECGLIAFSGFSVTPPAAMNNAKIEPIPNPLNDKPAASWLWVKQTYPTSIERAAIVYSDFLTTQVVKEQTKALWAQLGGFTVVDEIPTNPVGEANWVPFAQRLKDNQVSLLTIAGSSSTAINLGKAMREIGYVPEVVMLEASQYDQDMVAPGNAAGTEGFFVRSAAVPFEEADRVPAVKAYLDMMQEYSPEGKRALLGLHTTSAMLLFAQSANNCLDSNNNVLDRECVLTAGKAIKAWTGGGLHTETDPADNLPPKCGMVLTIKGGTFTRVYPELGSADDAGNGFACPAENATVHIEGDFGDPTPGIDPNRA